jgi:hypothetical protein
MAVDRRNILSLLAGRVFGGRVLSGAGLSGGLLAVLTGKVHAADAGTLYLNAYATAGAEPSFGVAALDRTGKVLFTTGRGRRLRPPARPLVPDPVAGRRHPRPGGARAG